LCSAALRAQTWDGERIVYAQRSSRRPVRAFYDLRYELWKLVVVMLPVGLLLAWWLGARAVRPIERLREQVLARKAGATTGPIALKRRDEIGDLATAFNDLLGALDGRRREHEAFVADLVHELKTPVAAIRASAEQLDDGADPRTKRLAKAVDDSARRLDALVTQLLELARAEGGLPGEARAEVDVAALARGLVASAKEDPRWSGVRVTARGAERAIVLAAPSRLDSALRNLIENAASFALPEGEVDVAIDAAGDEVSIAVKDTGPGIAESDLPRVFDRFFTTRGPAHGTGLGLALVKAVAQAHGGDVTVHAGAGRGATFRIVLPRK
jgi:two-component system sensor histidine kinase ChvG